MILQMQECHVVYQNFRLLFPQNRLHFEGFSLLLFRMRKSQSNQKMENQRV